MPTCTCCVIVIVCRSSVSCWSIRAASGIRAWPPACWAVAAHPRPTALILPPWPVARGPTPVAHVWSGSMPGCARRISTMAGHWTIPCCHSTSVQRSISDASPRWPRMLAGQANSLPARPATAPCARLLSRQDAPTGGAGWRRQRRGSGLQPACLARWHGATAEIILLTGHSGLLGQAPPGAVAWLRQRLEALDIQVRPHAQAAPADADHLIIATG